MMMRTILYSILFLIPYVVHAQNQFEIIAGSVMDDEASKLTATSTGNYLVCGSTFSFSPERRGLVLKTDSTGNVLWAKTYHLGSFCKLSQALELTDGNYLFSGYVVDTLRQETDVVLIKTDTSGILLWSKLYGTVGNDYIPSLKALVQMPDSGFAFTAGCDTNLTGREDLAIIRTDKNGDTLWTRFYHAIYRDQASSIGATADGGFIISGRTNSFDNFIMDLFLVKTDSVGSIEWAQRYGGPVWDEATGAVATSDGGFAVCGSQRSFSVAGEYDALVFKTDSAGIIQWVTSIGDSLDDALYGITETADGGYACAGITESFFNHQLRSSSQLDSDTTEVLAFKLNAVGDTVWCYVYGSEKIEEAYSIQQHGDLGFMIGGLSRSFSGNNSSDVFAVKTDSLGLSCTSSAITPVVYHPQLVSDTISFLEFSPLSYRTYSPNVIDVTIADSTLCYLYTTNQTKTENDHWLVMPNPFTFFITIANLRDNEIKNYKISITDLYGRNVTDQFVIYSSNEIRLNRKSALKNGVYFLTVSANGSIVKTFKLLAN